MNLAVALGLLALTFSAGVVIGIRFGVIARRRPRSLPPLDTSYRHPASQIESVIWQPARPTTWGSQRVS